MSIHPVFVLLLLSHILGDYYLQPKVMAVGKVKKWSWLIGHGMIHTVCMLGILVASIGLTSDICWILLVVNVSHTLIDFLKRFVKWKSFSLDQLAHLAILAVVWAIWGEPLAVKEFILYEFAYLQKPVILIMLGLLCILRPVGVLIEQGDVWDFSKSKNPPDESQKGAGKMIGYLERIIVYFLLIVGQYAAAVAFVVTAKIAVRYPELSKEKEGRALTEYFLIGTMLSMASVFVITLLLGLLRVN